MSIADEWRGIYAACFTPLTSDEQLDEDAFERAARALIGEGQRGLYVCGSTGEGYALADDVRCAAFRVAARIGRELNARIIAHVGSVPTRRAAAMARAAAECGCDSVAAIPPAGGRYSYVELTDYYTRLGQATALPLLVYHIPELSGYDFSRDELSRWLGLPNVAGIKFSSYDMYKLERLIALHTDKMFFHGADPMLMHGLAVGATGAIGSTYNLAGSIAIQIFESVRRNDIAAARRMQATLNTFIEVMHH
ncbi:MAG TPA: dihydrodipicolinate synthase family protein, partial [Planctomycetota bacterium]|nr:dihydrodipicolinate synthase family protein [Planctomycetota bacterium]